MRYYEAAEVSEKQVVLVRADMFKSKCVSKDFLTHLQSDSRTVTWSLVMTKVFSLTDKETPNQNDINVHHSVSGGSGGIKGHYPSFSRCQHISRLLAWLRLCHVHLTEDVSSILALGTRVLSAFRAAPVKGSQF